MKGRHGGTRTGAGRPPGATGKAAAEAREIALQWGPAAIERAARLAGLVVGVDGLPIGAAASDAAQISALEIVLARAYGRPPQAIAATVDIGSADFGSMLRERLAGARRLAEGTGRVVAGS